LASRAHSQRRDQRRVLMKFLRSSTLPLLQDDDDDDGNSTDVAAGNVSGTSIDAPQPWEVVELFTTARVRPGMLQTNRQTGRPSPVSCYVWRSLQTDRPTQPCLLLCLAIPAGQGPEPHVCRSFLAPPASRVHPKPRGPRMTMMAQPHRAQERQRRMLGGTSLARRLK
jgi:hypothetical protein